MSDSQGFYNYFERDDIAISQHQFGLTDVNLIGIWRQREQDILRIGNLRENWDGDSAHAISDDQVYSAVLYLSVLRNRDISLPPTRVIPSQDGEIILEWQGAGYYFEATISDPYSAEWMIESGGVVRHDNEQWKASNATSEKPTPVWQHYEAA